MPQQKSYAIRCSTEEQARECDSKKLLRYTLGNWYKFSHDTFGMYMLSKFNLEGYTIITYEEAKEMGLLVEKKVCKSCLGKKQHSVLVNHSFTNDFTGERHEQQSTIEMMNCGRCDGTGIEPEYVKEIGLNQDSVDAFHYGIDMAIKEPQQNIVNGEAQTFNELDTRDFDLCDIFNTTKTKSDLYMKIIDYLVGKGFLQGKDREVQESPKLATQWIKYPVKDDGQGMYIFDEKGSMICQVRGWGELQKQSNGIEIQDDVYFDKQLSKYFYEILIKRRDELLNEIQELENKIQ